MTNVFGVRDVPMNAVERLAVEVALSSGVRPWLVLYLHKTDVDTDVLRQLMEAGRLSPIAVLVQSLHLQVRAENRLIAKREAVLAGFGVVYRKYTGGTVSLVFREYHRSWPSFLLLTGRHYGFVFSREQELFLEFMAHGADEATAVASAARLAKAEVR